MSDLLRWMVEQYRYKLQEVEPEACRTIDQMMIHANQGWVCDTTVIDPDELLSAQDIQDRYGTSRAAIKSFILRNNIPVKGRLGKFNLYRLGDILAARSTNKKLHNL